MNHTDRCGYFNQKTCNNCEYLDCICNMIICDSCKKYTCVDCECLCNLRRESSATPHDDPSSSCISQNDTLTNGIEKQS